MIKLRSQCQYTYNCALFIVKVDHVFYQDNDIRAIMHTSLVTAAASLTRMGEPLKYSHDIFLVEQIINFISCV